MSYLTTSVFALIPSESLFYIVPPFLTTLLIYLYFKNKIKELNNEHTRNLLKAISHSDKIDEMSQKLKEDTKKLLTVISLSDEENKKLKKENKLLSSDNKSLSAENKSLSILCFEKLEEMQGRSNESKKEMEGSDKQVFDSLRKSLLTETDYEKRDDIVSTLACLVKGSGVLELFMSILEDKNQDNKLKNLILLQLERVVPYKSCKDILSRLVKLREKETSLETAIKINSNILTLQRRIDIELKREESKIKESFEEILENEHLENSRDIIEISSFLKNEGSTLIRGQLLESLEAIYDKDPQIALSILKRYATKDESSYVRGKAVEALNRKYYQNA